MARQISYETETGLVASSAYARVSRFNGDGKSLRFNVDIYANEPAYVAGKRPLDSQQFEFPMPQNAFNPVNACYSFLKTQPTYANGTDV